MQSQTRLELMAALGEKEKEEEGAFFNALSVTLHMGIKERFRAGSRSRMEEKGVCDARS
jgi:hypothetical protein